jgi:hypothetical protein
MSDAMAGDSKRAPCALMTLKDLDAAGRDVRAWCFGCARGQVVDAMIWKRFDASGWDMGLSAAAARFRCKGCGSAADVRLYPAWREPVPANAAARLVERFFHDMRALKAPRFDKRSADFAADYYARIEKRRRAAVDREARAARAQELRATFHLVPKRKKPGGRR